MKKYTYYMNCEYKNSTYSKSGQPCENFMDMLTCIREAKEMGAKKITITIEEVCECRRVHKD